eukprot:scaffold2961_cov166-Chaetoceros_neogracile.AAC.3
MQVLHPKLQKNSFIHNHISEPTGMRQDFYDYSCNRASESILKDTPKVSGKNLVAKIISKFKVQ